MRRPIGAVRGELPTCEALHSCRSGHATAAAKAVLAHKLQTSSRGPSSCLYGCHNVASQIFGKAFFGAGELRILTHVDTVLRVESPAMKGPRSLWLVAD